MPRLPLDGSMTGTDKIDVCIIAVCDKDLRAIYQPMAAHINGPRTLASQVAAGTGFRCGEGSQLFTLHQWDQILLFLRQPYS